MNISDASSRCVNSLLQAHMDHSKRVYNGSIGESASVVDPIDDSVSKGTALGSAGWPVGALLDVRMRRSRLAHRCQPRDVSSADAKPHCA